MSPILVGGTIATMNMSWKKEMKGGIRERKEGQEAVDEDKANAIISDIIMNYKTVISFG